MTVSRKVRKELPASRKVSGEDYPMPDKKHAAIAKAFAAMHHDPRKAEIDRKADAILRNPHGSGEFDPTNIVNGYMPMGSEGMYAMSWEQQQQQAAAQAAADKKRKRGGR